VKHLMWLAAVALTVNGTANAADLAKVPRTIAKEPAYQTKYPRYALLVFGEQASPRIWVVLDGDTAYVDRNGNGDLTEADEKVAMPEFKKQQGREAVMEGQREVTAGSITTGPNTTQQLMLMQMRLAKNPKPRTDEEGEMLKLFGNPPDGIFTGIIVMNELPKALIDAKGEKFDEPIMHMAMADQRGALEFSDRPEKAPIVHIGGPLQIQLHLMQKLIRGQQSELSVCIGTPGLGKGTFVMRGYQGVPKDVYPVVDLEFPAKEPGAEAIKLQVVLKERC
jgi:hypothetical protein